MLTSTLRRTAVYLVVFGFFLSASVAAQDRAKIELGVKAYAAQKCDKCHSIAGKGAKRGPLDEVGTKLSEDEIRQWLIDPATMAKKTKSTLKPVMKPLKAPKEEIDAIVDMQSLKKG